MSKPQYYYRLEKCLTCGMSVVSGYDHIKSTGHVDGYKEIRVPIEHIEQEKEEKKLEPRKCLHCGLSVQTRRWQCGFGFHHKVWNVGLYANQCEHCGWTDFDW